MQYATRSDMENRFGESELIALTDRQRDGVINDTVLNQALADANALIDVYIAGRYPTPLASIPPALVGKTCDLARYNLYDDVCPESIKQRHSDAIRFLEQIAAGRIALSAPDGSEQTTDSDVVVIESAGSVWARDNSKGYL